MEYFIIAVIAFIAGYKISEIIHVISFKKILEDLNVNKGDLVNLHQRLLRDHGLEEESPRNSAAAGSDGKTVIDIKVEQHEGQLYAYTVNQNQFIAQGQTSDELLGRILDKYPTNVRVICDVANGGELINDAAQRLAAKRN